MSLIKTIYIGVDPGGSSGGAAAILTLGSGKQRVQSVRFKDCTEQELSNWFKSMKDLDSDTVMAVLEKVHAMPKQGVSSTFKFGQNYGFLRGVMATVGIAFDDKTPQQWQKLYGMKKDKNETQNAWKKRLKQRAQQMFPDHKVRSEEADAILMANYCQRIYG